MTLYQGWTPPPQKTADGLDPNSDYYHRLFGEAKDALIELVGYQPAQKFVNEIPNYSSAYVRWKIVEKHYAEQKASKK